MFVYLITNKVNGKLYVGQTRLSVEERWQRHIVDSTRKRTPLYSALKKYGSENFYVEPLCSVSGGNQKLLNAVECFFIQYHECLTACGYNVLPGGTIRLNETEIKKMSKSLTGRVLSNSHRENIGRVTRLRWANEEFKQKVSDKISRSLAGKPLSQEHKEKLSRSHSGKKLSAAHRQKMSEGQKKRQELIRQEVRYGCYKN